MIFFLKKEENKKGISELLNNSFINLINSDKIYTVENLYQNLINKKIYI